MYNDYYLQSIDNKLSTTNNRLSDIIDNQKSLISGDIYIKNEIINSTKTLNTTCMCLCFMFAFFLLAELVEHYLGIK